MAALNNWFARRNDPTGAAIKKMMQRGIPHKEAVAIAVRQKIASTHLQKDEKSSTVNLRRKNKDEPERFGPPVDTSTES